jgi:hypothetical protein
MNLLFRQDKQSGFSIERPLFSLTHYVIAARYEAISMQTAINYVCHPELVSLLSGKRIF